MKKKICYVLGAGFSAYAGLPVMANFIDKAKDIYFDNPAENTDIIKVVALIGKYAILHETMSCNLSNIEELLSIAEMYAYLAPRKKDNMIANFIKHVIDFYEKKFTEKCILSPNDNNIKFAFRDKNNRYVFSNEQNDYFYFVSALFQLQYKGTYKTTVVGGHDIYNFDCYVEQSNYKYGVISFNYDTILETIMNKIHTRCDNMSDEIVFNRERITDNSIRYCKLHGSTDDNTIVPPTWAKHLQASLKKDWQDAYTLLKEANEIRIIGFSFPDTDSHVTYLFKSALIENPNLKKVDVICLDDSMSSIESKYKTIFPTKKLSFKNGNIKDYFHELKNEYNNYKDLLERAHDKVFREVK